jgi:hypothetical protein
MRWRGVEIDRHCLERDGGACRHGVCTDKKEKQIFLIYKENSEWSSCKVIYIGLSASLYMVNYLRISSYIRKPFLIYDFATAPL